MSEVGRTEEAEHDERYIRPVSDLPSNTQLRQKAVGGGSS